MYIGKLKAIMNLGFPRSVNAVFVELRYYAALIGSWYRLCGKAYRFPVRGSSSQKTRNASHLKVGSTGGPETSVIYYQSRPHNISEQRRL
jgi:hypothetical protein